MIEQIDERMKLAIDIPDKMYEEVKSGIWFENNITIIFQIPQGKQVRYIRCEMLDKIRAEIEQISGNEYEVSNMQGNVYKYETIEKTEVLQIIDKYKASLTGAESEG